MSLFTYRHAKCSSAFCVFSLPALLPQALHHDKPESYDENLRAYQQASRARPAWLPEHTPRGEVGPCMRTANDHISRAKSDIHEAFSALPSLHLGHSELCSSASGEAVACSLRAGGATAGSDVQECVAFLNKLDSQLMPCIDQVRHNKAAYERAVAKYG